MNLLTSKAFWIEMGASFFTVTGVWLGTTTLNGAIYYLIGCGFWIVIMVKNNLWGIAPLNVFATLATLYNLWVLLK